MYQLNRIAHQHDVLSGKARTRGTCVTVSQIAAGLRVNKIPTDDCYMAHDDIMSGLCYAAWGAEERETMLGDV